MSANSSDGASAAASQKATSPFSPHATAFGPTSTSSLGASSRMHGLASDGQSLSSRASSFTSVYDSAPSKGIVLKTSDPAGAPELQNMSSYSTEATPSSASLLGFDDHVHSRQSSFGAASNVSAASAAAAATRWTPSPLHRPSTESTSFAPPSADSLSQTQLHALGTRSPTSLAPPYPSDAQQRRFSSSLGVRADSPSLAPPTSANSANSGARPHFERHSVSDGMSNASGNLIAGDMASGTMEAGRGSFSGSFPPTEAFSPRPAEASPSVFGLPDATLASGTAPAPTTGPLSASDPRTQLLVSNLPYRVRWQDLKDLFRKAGTVLRADVSLSADNRSRGYGTVLMATEQDAIKAADMLGGFTWQGRTLDVRIDRSGTLVGVAGSAVMPTLANTNGLGNGATSSPNNAVANGYMASNAALHAKDQGFSTHQFLGVPSSFGGQGHLPGSISGAASPSALSPLARPADRSQSVSTRAPFLAQSDFGQNGANQTSELERAMLQGHGASGATGNQTPNRQQPGSNYDAGFGGQAQHRALSAVHSQTSNQMGSRRGSDIGAALGASSSGGWGSGNPEAVTGLYSQNAGGSSVPTGFPGATAMAPWPAGPGSLGGQGVASMQSQPFNSQIPTTSYAGRVLFVGNLPFHCQWQDLKDLFRAAGNIQRADVAIGPDGRSRGFGTVLFATQEDAQNAVRLYHGYEYSGRTLKVHFDRFAAQNGPAVGTPGNPAQYTGAFAAAALPSHMTNNVRAPALAPGVPAQPMQTGVGQHQYLHQSMQPQRGGPSMSFVPQQQAQASFGQAAFQQQNSLQYASQHQPSSLQQHQQGLGQAHHQHMIPGFSAFADAGRTLQSQSTQQPFSGFGSLTDARSHVDGSTSERRTSAQPFGTYSELSQQEGATSSAKEKEHGMSITLPANDFGAASSYLPSDLMSPGLVSPPAPMQLGQSGPHPGRIQLPSSNFAHSFGAASGTAQTGQMSPMTARMQVPMTPGMPGFTFHQVPETPPLYPQFLSPGLGPFSPTISGTSQMGGGPAVVPQNVGMNMGGYMNVAPGAPLHPSGTGTPGVPAGYNPMFPTAAAAFAQQQPATPHWSQPSGPRRGGAVRQSMGPQAPSVIGPSHGAEADELVDGFRTNIAKTPGAGPRRRSQAADDHRPGDVGGAGFDERSDAVEPSISDGYPFPMVAAGNVAHLTRRASTNSPAGTPLASGPAGGSSMQEHCSAPIGEAPLRTADVLAGTSAEELANTIARLSVKGTALARDSSSRRSLSMTAERSAAASAMAKLRDRVGTPTPPTEEEAAGSESASASAGLGPPFTSSALGQQKPVGKLLGLSIADSALEAARNGSALDTGSEAGGSRRSTPRDEGGAEHTT